MNGFIVMFCFGLAGLLFFVSGIFAIQPARVTRQPNAWRLWIVACFVLAVCLGVFTYSESTTGTSPDPAKFLAAVLVFIGSGLVCGAMFVAAKRAVAIEALKHQVEIDLNRFRLSFEQAPYIAIIKDSLGNYLYTNSMYQSFIGKKGQLLTGETDFKFFPRAQAQSFRQTEEKVFSTKSPSMRDEEIHGIEGFRWVRFSRIPLEEEDNRPSMLVIGQDITVQKNTEEEQRWLTQRLGTLKGILFELTSQIDPKSLLESLVVSAGRLTDTTNAGIWQILPERRVAVLRYAGGQLASALGKQIKMASDVPWKVWQTGQPVVVEQYSVWPERSPWPAENNFLEAIGLPVGSSHQPGFVLTLFFENNSLRLIQKQVALLEILTTTAASQLHHLDMKLHSVSENQTWQQQVEKVQFRSRLEHLLAVVATYFIGVESEKIDESIAHALETVVKMVGADRGYAVLFPGVGANEPAIIINGHPIHAPIDGSDYRKPDFQPILMRLNQLETVHIPQIQTNANDHNTAAAYLGSKGIKSFTAIPLISNRSLVGYLGFESHQKEMEWSAEILGILKNHGDMITNLLERKRLAKQSAFAEEQAQLRINQLVKKTQENDLINQLGDLLQASRTADEAYPIIVQYMEKLIPFCSGALYLIGDAKDPAEKMAAWGIDPPGAAEHELALNECWALRRGRTYTVSDPETEPVCTHIKESLQSGYLCTPLFAQSEVVGVLHLRMPDSGQPKLGFSAEIQSLAERIGGYISITLTNLNLRDVLRSQAIRDPLTKLFNRRYMEETLDREIRRANRHNTSVGIIMFDIDKMKPINDCFGHDAGDLVLKSLGLELINLFRGEDVACRYGGDEFTVVLPEASLADVWRRAEQMRDAVRRLDLTYDGKKIGPLTLSIGVAAYPDHGASAERLLMACDAASYVSKAEGGDRIMMAHKNDV